MKLLFQTRVWCGLILVLYALSKPLAHAQSPVDRPVLSIEERLSIQEAEIRELRERLAEHELLIQPLPPVESAVSVVGYEEVSPNPASSDSPSSIETRFNAFEKDWQQFQEKLKSDKSKAAEKPSMELGGQVQIDFVSFGQDTVSRESVGDLQDGSDFRRARIVIRGKAFDVFEYAFGVDFALAGRPSFLDMYIEHHDLPFVQNARVGHFFEPFSLERVTQNRNNTFMERSLVDTFAPARNVGAMIYGHAENLRSAWQIGTFRTDSDNYGNDSFDSGQALTMRHTWLPYWDEGSDGRYYVHLGAAYSYRDTKDNQVRFRNTPEIRKEQPGQGNFAPIFVDTGNIPASHFQLFDAEFAWINGPFSVQSEYAFSTVEQTGGPDLFFDAYMVQVSYFLTGEHRPYDRNMGIHSRMHPFSNFFRVRTRDEGIQMGSGAWEVAARYSWIDLTDRNILGNDLKDFTFGLNWYLNPYLRCKFDYIRAFLDDPLEGRSNTNIFGMRVDYEF